jgi:hypothetical protein
VTAQRLKFAAGPAAALVAIAVVASSDSGADQKRPLGVAAAQPTGSLVQADALGNTRIGGPDRTALAFRFRGSWTGSIVAVRCYVITNRNGRTGYSGGDGGRLRVALRADSGRRPHVPVGRPLTAAMVRPSRRGFWPLIRFRRPARIKAGRLYHVVFSNVDPDPERNYVSINALYSASRLGRGPRLGRGLGVLLGHAAGARIGGWEPRPSRPREHYLPILAVAGRRAEQRSGQGYMEVWDPKPIGDHAAVRQLVTTADGRPSRVEGAWLRVRRRKETRASLVLRLESPAGRVLASAAVRSTAVPTSAPGWVHVRFATPVRAAPGTRLALTASAPDASTYEAFPIRKGTGFGFGPGTFFARGYAQFNDGGGWEGWDQWSGRDRRNSDLQFALDVVR